MRLAFDATPLLDRRTGVGVFVAEVLGRLAVRHDVDVVAFAFTRKFLPELRAALPAGIPAIRRPLPSRTMRIIWERANRPAIERWTGPVDLVHGPNFVVPPSRSGVEIVTVHDLTCLHFPELCDELTIRYPAFIRRAIARGAHVHTVSQFVADEVMDAFGIEPARVHAIHNGVTPVAAGDPNRGRTLAGADRFVVSIGTIEPRKNLGTLIDAADSLPAEYQDLRIVLAGGQGWGPDLVGSAIERSARPDRVVRLGRVTEDQKADLLAGALALAYPSRYEGFGLPPLEAMSVGVPVLATRVGALPEVLGEAALFVDPNAEAIAAGLVEIIDNDARRADLAKRGRALARRYTWDATVERLISLYGDLTNPP